MKQGSSAWLSAHGPEPALVGMVLLSAVIHIAAVITIFLLPRDLLQSTPPPIVAYTVKIVDPSALGGRLPKGPLRPEKEPVAAPVAPPEPAPETKEEPKPEPEPPPKKPEPKSEPEENVVKIPEKKPEPTVAKKPQPKPTAKPVAKATAKPAPKKPSAAEIRAREQAARDRQIQEAVRKVERRRGKEAAGLGGTEDGAGAALGTGGDGGGGGVLAGLDFILYKNQVESIIKKNWTWVGSNPNLTVRVGFRIQNDGAILDIRVVSGSGDAGYDQSVLRAVHASTPLPAPPERYRDVFGNYLIDFVSGELQSG